MCKFFSALLTARAVAILFVLPVFSASAWAAADPGQPVRRVAAEVIEIVKTKTGAARETALRQVLHNNFDLSYMGRSVLGAHWNEASEQQRARFLAAVETSEARACGERLGLLAGFTMTIDKVTARPDSAWIVDSLLSQAGAPPIKLTWEVRDNGPGPRIVDVKVAGVSLFMTLRSEFNAYIQGNSGRIEPLVEELEAHASR